MKKILSAALSIILIFSLSLGALAAVPWPSVTYLAGLETPFSPPDKYVSKQNPPDFSWPAVKNAQYYDLVVAYDEALSDIAYRKDKLVDNLYNFSMPFEPGKTYYWSVRYTASGVTYDWTDVRRFRIDPDATEFTVPETIEDMINNIPDSHPRYMLSKERLPEIREKLKYGEAKRYYDEIKRDAKAALNQPIEPEPTTPGTLAELYWTVFQGAVPKITTPMMKCALVYLIEGDAEYGKYAAELLCSLAGWDPDGVSGYKSQDQAHTQITQFLAYGYDWLYDILTPDQRAKVLLAEKVRATTLAESMVTGDVSIKERPYESHGWTQYNAVLEISMILMGDLPECEDWLKQTLRTYVNLYPIYSEEDGGYSQGTSYYESMDPVKDLKLFGVDMTKKAWAQNVVYFPIYQFPAGSVGAFGDQSYQNHRPDSYNLLANYMMYYGPDDERSKYASWELDELNGKEKVKYPEPAYNQVRFINSVINGFYDVKSEPPYKLPKSRLFYDIGWTSMHSDLVDKNRISLFFKSSPFGSYNHSHADQNSFVIRAFGENLAIDSGYYAYGTAWADNYYRQTFAHNGLTVNDGKGQTINDFEAKGKITEHLTHADFDMVKGDAKEAYPDLLTKADRYIIYIRPDAYIVVDDVEAKSTRGAKYEFWLNGHHDAIKVYDSKDGARLTRNRAVLDARVVYPEVTPKYSNIFSGADWMEIPTTYAYRNSQKQERVWFSTERSKGTKIVTTLDVHRIDDGPQLIENEKTDKYVKLSFENGSTAIINLTDDEEITVDNITFKGVAVVYNNDTYMLVSGTRLVKDGATLVESDKKLSVERGRGELAISAPDDLSVNIKLPGVTKLTLDSGRPLSEETGGTYEEAGEYKSFNLTKGNYYMSENGKDIKPAVSNDAGLGFMLDGNYCRLEGTKVTDLKGDETSYFKYDFPKGVYKIEEQTKGINVNNGVVGDYVFLNGTTDIVYNGNTPGRLIINNANLKTDTAEKRDGNLLKTSLSVIKEAEDMNSFTGVCYVYEGNEFNSGLKCLYGLKDFYDTATYEVNISEDGYYDFCMNYTAPSGDALRKIVIDGEISLFTCPKTSGDGFGEGDWSGLLVNTGRFLKAGKHTVTVGGMDNSVNIDWIGFAKR